MRQIATIIIKNKQGEYFVHLRSQDKKLYPNKYGLGAGGKFETGETPIEVACRELEEETGLKLIPNFKFEFEFTDGEINHKVYVFDVVTEIVPQWDRLEWQSVSWITKEEVVTLRDTDQLCPDTKILFDRYVIDSK